MIRYFLRAMQGRLRASPSLDVLTVLGVALGVASVLSIQILNGNALGAFQGSVRALSGEADLTVVGQLPSLFVAHSRIRGALQQPLCKHMKQVFQGVRFPSPPSQLPLTKPTKE